MADDSKKPPVQSGISPKGVAVWPNFRKPDYKFNADGVYKTGLKVSAEDSEALRTKVEKLTQAHMVLTKKTLQDLTVNGKDGKAKKAAKDALEKLTFCYPWAESVDEDGNETGDFELAFKSNAKITVKGEIRDKKITVFDCSKPAKEIQGEVWGGSVIKVAFDFVPYHMASTGAVGISFRMNSVQVVQLKGPGQGGSGAAPDFGDEEDGYQSDAADGSEFQEGNSSGDEPSDSGEEENRQF